MGLSDKLGLRSFFTEDGYVPPLNVRLKNIIHTIKENEEAEAALPGLARLLEKYMETPDSIDQEDFVRQFLLIFKNSPDMTYENTLQKYDPDEQEVLTAFVGGTPLKEATEGLVLGPTLGARQEAQQLVSGDEITLPLAAEHPAEDDDDLHVQSRVKQQAIVKDEKASERTFQSLNVSVYKNAKFQNWGLNVENVPQLTFVPRTLAGVVAIVKYAKAYNMSVRVSGYRHSWSPTFGTNGQLLISTLGIDLATRLPNFSALPGAAPGDAPDDLNRIEWASETRYLVRVGSGVTNEQLRRWCNNQGGKPRATLPLNTIMVEMTCGGSNAPMCHGAGIKQPTLSDLVKRIEYVDANGIPRTIDEQDERFLSAASGCFGLIGVITHLTLQLEPMSYALLRPIKVDVIRAVPPPPGMKLEDIPPMLQKNLSPQERADDQADFERRALNNYYAEWFWFPYHDQVWINTWDRTDDPTGADAYPGTWGKIVQFTETVLLQVVQNTLVYRALGEWFALRVTTLFSIIAMQSLPDAKDGLLKTFLPDALHFRRSIQNIRVRDVEVSMPLEPSKDPAKKIDFTNVQRAWWDAIILTYANMKKSPMRMPLEMRIMSDSKVIMAAQRGNTYGTCTIEVLTLQAHADEFGWKEFAQKVIDKWMAYRDANGKLLKTRPHWAKEWYDYDVNGQRWIDKLKNEDYKDEIKEFKAILTEIGQRDGWTLQDIQRRFSNDMYDKLIYS